MTLSVFGGVDSRTYRLAKRQGAIGEGSFEIRQSEVGLGIQIKVAREIRIQVETAVVLGQHLSFRDDNRQTVDAIETRRAGETSRHRT